jgi:Flp pilus assembly pilin Flp
MIILCLNTLKAGLSRWDFESEGQGLVEYAMIILFVAIGCLVALTGMAGAIQALWQRTSDFLIPALGV